MSVIRPFRRVAAPGPCAVPGCEARRHARGLCATHYSRHRAGTELFAPVRRALVGSAAERLLAAVEYDTNGGCWLWPYAVHDAGYGVIFHEGRLWKAHRLAYAAFVGEIPAGREVCHRCDVPACFNPDHLFLGTHAENMADMARKGRWNPEAARRGEANGCARLKEAEVREIRAAARVGETYTAIGQRFGVSRVTVAKIVAGKAWAHVSQEEAA